MGCINLSLANPGILIFLIYLPPILFALDASFRKKFFKVHKSKTGSLVDVLIGLIYFLIIIYAATLTLSKTFLTFTAGTIIYLIGLTITFMGYHTFFTSEKIIQKFPYNFSRNPTYFFGLVAILGITIATKSLVLLILLAAQFWLTHKVILQEEEFLTKRYKNQFKKYAKKVSRYF